MKHRVYRNRKGIKEGGGWQIYSQYIENIYEIVNKKTHTFLFFSPHALETINLLYGYPRYFILKKSHNMSPLMSDFSHLAHCFHGVSILQHVLTYYSNFSWIVFFYMDIPYFVFPVLSWVVIVFDYLNNTPMAIHM